MHIRWTASDWRWFIDFFSLLLRESACSGGRFDANPSTFEIRTILKTEKQNNLGFCLVAIGIFLCSGTWSSHDLSHGRTAYLPLYWSRLFTQSNICVRFRQLLADWLWRDHSSFLLVHVFQRVPGSFWLDPFSSFARFWVRRIWETHGHYDLLAKRVAEHCQRKKHHTSRTMTSVISAAKSLDSPT